MDSLTARELYDKLVHLENKGERVLDRLHAAVDEADELYCEIQELKEEIGDIPSGATFQYPQDEAKVEMKLERVAANGPLEIGEE